MPSILQLFTFQASTRCLKYIMSLLLLPFLVFGQSDPVVTSSPVTSVDETVPYLYQITVEDIDGDNITVSAPTLPGWLNLRGPQSYQVSTLAGSGTFTHPPIDGTGTEATFIRPIDLTTDSQGNIYVLDDNQTMIRKVTPAGVVTTFVGDYAVSNAAGVDGTGTDARFRNILGITIDHNDNIYVVDLYKIRKITPSGVVTTIAGDRDKGTADGTGTDARFQEPTRLAADSNGDIFVCDRNNFNVAGRIRKVTPDGVVTTIAGGVVEGTTGGTGTDALFFRPFSIAIDGNDNFYFAELRSRIYKMTPEGVVTPFAGNGSNVELDGTGTNAAFRSIRGLATDGDNNLYVVSGDNSTNRVRKVSPAGVVTSPIGSLPGYIDGFGTDSKFSSPMGVTVAADGTIYVADKANSAIRKVVPLGYLLEGDATGQQGTHNVTLNITDDNGGTASQSFSINVMDSTDPVFTSASSVPVIEQSTGTVYTATATDANALTFTLGNGNDNALFNIDQNSGEVSFKNSPVWSSPADNDEDNIYQISVVVSDGSNSITEEVILIIYPISSTLNGEYVQIGADIDGEASSDWSGHSISLSGDGKIMAIGAPFSAEVAFGSGDVRVFQFTGNSWDQLGSDIPGARSASNFGNSVSLSAEGKVLAVGAIGFNASGTTTGYTGIYAFENGDWVQIGSDINGESAGDNAGSAVALSKDGKTVAIGAVGNSDNGSKSGHVRIYRRQDNNWTQIGADIDGEAAADQSGTSVAISANGNIVAIGAPFNDGNFDKSGHVRVYEYVNDQWTQVGIDINGQHGGDEFGTSVDLSADGQTMAVGGRYNDVNGTHAGHVRVFRLQNGNWNQLGSAILGDAADAELGFRVAISDDGSIVAATARNNQLHNQETKGEVKVFRYSGVNWEQLGTDIIGETGGDRLGFSLSISADGSIIAASSLQSGATGYTHAYELTNTPPQFTSALTASFAENGTGVAYTAQATDSETITYSLGTGNDESLFTVDGTSGEVSFINAPDFESPGDSNNDNSYLIQVKADDGTNESSQQVTISVTNVSDVNPVFTSVPITAVDDNETYSYQVTASDADGDDLSFEGTSLPGWLSLNNSGWIVTTLAGSGSQGLVNGTGTGASFNNPYGIAVDNNGNVYVVENANHTVRKIDPEGVVSTFAGSGSRASVDGNGTEASFDTPIGVAIDQAGNLFITEEGSSHNIRKITPEGMVTTFAGSGSQGFVNGTGTDASFTAPWGIAIDAAGNIYVADSRNDVIRKITPGGAVSTFAGSGTKDSIDGSGTNASFNAPTHIALDAAGNLYVAEIGNHQIRKVTSAGIVTTIAGTGSIGSADGTGTNAGFNFPYGITALSDGTLYVSDQSNFGIRKISKSGVVTTIAGTGNQGDADGTGTSASFRFAIAIASDNQGNLYVGDTGNDKIRKINFPRTDLSGNPSGQAGSHDVTLTANDSGGGTATQSFTIVVADKTGPDASISINDLDMGPSETGQVTVSFNEAVNNFTNDDLSIPNGTLSAVSSSDEGKTFTATYTPSNGVESETNVITLDLTQVEDLAGNAGSGTVSTDNFIVDRKAPIFTSPLAVEFAENTSGIAYTTQVTDQSAVTFSKSTSNDGFQFDFGENGLAAFSSTPDFESPDDKDRDNVYLLDITATDAKGNASTTTVSITVTNVNDNAPSFISEPITMANEGQEYIYNVRATDPDGDALGFTGSFPSWLSLGANQGMQVTTFAGSYRSTFTDGIGTNASFNSPYGIDVDQQANIYVADYGHNRIRKITPSGEVTTLAGSGKPGNKDSFQDLAEFNRPTDLVIDASGMIYVTDEKNFSIRKITPAGLVSTLAGGNGRGTADGIGTDAKFGELKGIDIDGAGNLYVADKGSRKIRKVTPGGMVSTLAGSGNFESVDGTGTNASFANLEGIVVDNEGNLYVTDGYARNVRKITTAGVVTTLAGSGNQITMDGTGTEASFFNLNGIDVDDEGNVYVAEFTRGTIRKITPEGVVTSVVGGDSGVDALYSALGIVWVSGGTIYATGHTQDNVYKLRPDNVIELIAGGGKGTPKNGDRVDATLNWPQDIVVHQQSGYIFFSDKENHMIRKISPDGQISTFAGSGIEGFADGSPVVASFSRPSGIVMNSAGFLFVADQGNNRIRMIDPNGNVSTFVGSGNGTFADGTGALASFNGPWALAIDEDDNLYVSDLSNARIRKVSPDRAVTTFAGSGIWNFADGTGTEAAFVQPMGLSFDSDGNLYVADQGNRRVRKITPEGVVTTVAGSGDFESKDGTGTNASFASPMNVLVDKYDNIYVAENNRIRHVTPEGVVSTFAGSGEQGATDGIGANATFYRPWGLAFNLEGDILVADTRTDLIRKMSVPGVSLTGDPTGQIGEHDVTLTVSDGGGNTDQQTFKIQVKDSDIPVFISAKTATVEENTTSTFYTATALDANTLSYSLLKLNEEEYRATTFDAGYLRIDPQSGELSFGTNVDFDDVLDHNGDNVYEVILLATDASGNVGSLNLAITMTETIDNSNPVFVSNPVLTTSDDQEYCYLIKTTDGENNPITIIGTNLPAWLSLSTSQEGEVTTLAGNGGTGAINGTGTLARFNFPAGITVDGIGNLYVVDQDNHSIRKVSPGGVVTSFVGSGVKGFADGTGNTAQFSDPKDITIDSEGNIYVADFENHRIRKVTPDGVVSTLAGTGGQGAINGTGTSASFNYPAGVAVDTSGNVYVVDQDNHSVRKITPAGVVSTLAGSGAKGFADGSGTEARFSDPKDITIDVEGTLYVADFENHRIRKITPAGVVSTVAGTGIPGAANGTGSAASFNYPAGITADLNKNLYVVDQDNHAIRKISANGVVTTLAGSGAKGFADGTGTEVHFSDPKDITIDSLGNLYIADFENHRIRKITTSTTSLKGDPSGQIGDHSVTLTATDGNGGTAEQSFVVTVMENNPPVFTSNPSTLVELNASYKYKVAVEDPDGDALTVSAPVLPDWLSLTSQNVITTIAGGIGEVFRDGAGTEAGFRDPRDLVVDRAGNAYIADSRAHVIRKVDKHGVVTTFVGELYEPGITEGTGTAARLANPIGLAIDAEDNLYVASSGYFSTPSTRIYKAVQKITPDGVVSLIAGGFKEVYEDGTGTDAGFTYPNALTMDDFGNLYMADNLRIRKITQEGVVTTLAGNGSTDGINGTGTLASFETYPEDLITDAVGNVYVSDGDLIRKITPQGVMTTFTGSAGAGYMDGSLAEARFRDIRSLSRDEDGNIYVGDGGNFRVRKIDTNGMVTTIAGTDSFGQTDGPATESLLYAPTGLFAQNRKSIFMIDHVRASYRKIELTYCLEGAPGDNFGDHNVTLKVDDDNGGTSEQSFVITASPESTPEFTSGGLASFQENASGPVYTAMAIDANPEAVLSYGIANELDAALFSIDSNTGILTFLSPPDFENPGDGDEDNRYELKIQVQNDSGNGPEDLMVIIQVTNESDVAPEFISEPITEIGDNTLYNYNIQVADGDNESVVVTAESLPDWLTLMQEYEVTTLAGSGTGTVVNATALSASFQDVNDLVVDSRGNVYVSDGTAHLIRKIDTRGNVSTFVGAAYAAGLTEGTGTNARLARPMGLGIDASDNIYIAMNGYFRPDIRINTAIGKVTPEGHMTILAGGGTAAHLDGTGTLARFEEPTGLVSDPQGNVYILDKGRVKKIDTHGKVTTLSINSSTSLTLSSASDLTIDDMGNLFFVHASRNAVSKLRTDGRFNLFAGSGQDDYVDGTGFDARFNGPLSIGIDEDNLLYVAEQGNLRIRRIDENGVVTTVTGSGTRGYRDGGGSTAQFSSIFGLYVKRNGNILLADKENARVREINPVYRLSGNPFGQTGNHDVELTVTDDLGASDEQDFTIVVNDVSGPVFSSGTTADFAENGTGVAYQALATDPAGVSYSLGNTLDEGLFTITANGEISFLNPPNFESPADANTDNTYALTLIATDGFANTTTLDLEISVTDIVEADPVILSTPVTTINEGDDYHYAVKAIALGEGVGFNTSLPSWLSTTTLQEGSIETLAGSIISSFQDGTGIMASFNKPSGIDIDAEGNIYVADQDHHRIRKITPEGIVSTIAGSGRAGDIDGTGTDARLNSPNDLAVDQDGNVYFVGSKSYTIRKVSSDGVITTLAGGPERGYVDGTGTQARFGALYAIDIDSKSNIIVSDFTSYSIRVITPEGVVSTLAGSGNFASVNGTGTEASFQVISGIAVGAQDHIYVAESTSGTIRRITPEGIVSTFAGSGENTDSDGTGTSASFARLGFLETDVHGNLYLSGGTPGRIRKITTEGVVTTILGGDSGVDLSALEEDYLAVGIAVGGAGDIFVTESRRHYLYTLSDGTASIFAGGGSGTYQDGNRADATFRFPRGSAIDPQGNIYMVDAGNHVIRKISTDGTVSTLAGSGTYGDQDGTGTNASFWSPWDIVIDTEGVLYVSDLGSGKIKKVTPEGVVSTFVGSGTRDYADGTGTNAMFTSPNGMDMDAEGNIYLSDSFQNSRIRKITPEGVVTTLAGSGTSGYLDGTGTEASFRQTIGLAVGPDGNIYVGDDQNQRIRKITPEGVVTTFAGSGNFKQEDGSGTEASFLSPRSMTFDDEGNLYVADRSYIRMISPEGEVKTVAGSGITGALDGIGTSATLGTRLHLEAGKGGLIIGDELNHLVRKLNLASLKITGNSLNQAGDHNISISITDENGKTAEQNFILKVIAAPVPVFTSSETANFAENGTGIAYTATTEHTSEVTYSLGSDNDESLFSIDQTSGEVSFITPPDFENPQDGDANNAYLIQVKAGDGVKEASQLVTITVTDIDDAAPVVTSVFASNGDEDIMDRKPFFITVKFSKPVLVEGTPQLELETGEVNGVANYINGSSTDELLFLYTVQGGDFTERLDYTGSAAFTAGTSIKDAAGNTANLTLPEVGETGSISDNNQVSIDARPEVTLSVDKTLLSEDTESLDLRVSLSFASRTSVAINLDFSGTADAGTDYSIAGGTSINMQPGTLSYTGGIVTRQDNVSEPDETVVIAISNVSGVKGVVGEQQKTITIVDDEGPVFDSGVSVDFIENDTQVAYIAEASDVQNVTYDLGVENDESFFDINETTGEVSFITPPDFENPQDNDNNNDYVLEVKASDGTNEVTQLVTISVTDVNEDITPPDKPVITGISEDTGSSDSDGITNDKNIVIRGMAEPLSNVEVSTQYGLLRSTQTDINGDWVLDVTDITLVEVAVDLTAEAIDQAGNRSVKSEAFALTPDFTAPAKPLITGISEDTGVSDSDGITNDKNIVIRGMAEPLSNVEVSTQYGLLRSTQTDINGDWVLDITDIALVEVAVDLTAEAIDQAGNRSVKSEAFALTPDFTAPAKPVITGISDDTGSSSSDGVTKDKNVTINGTAEPLSKVEISTQFGLLRSTQADINGNWILDIIDITLVELVVGLTARAVDLAGNRSEASDSFVLTPDFTAPAQPVITGITEDTGISDSDGITNDRNIIISGTSEANAMVEVSSQYGPIRGTKADTNGNWSLDITDISLLEIIVHLNAEAVDLAGNRSVKSEIFTLIPDFTAPDKPVITGISDDTGSSGTDGVTNDKNVTINGTAEPLTKVEISTQFGLLRGTQANAEGDWVLDIRDITLVELVVGLTAKAVDPAGNRSEASDPFVLTPDFTAPDKPVITGISEDTGLDGDDGITNDRNITISGTAEANATVEISSQYGPIRSTQADANGHWLLDITDITLFEVRVDLTAEAVDLAGNRSLKSDAFILTPDFTAPWAIIDIGTITPAGHTITVLFDEPVSGLVLGEISVTGGTAGNLVQTSDTSYSFLISLTGSTADVQINAGAVQDVAGNHNVASNQLTINTLTLSVGEGSISLPDQGVTGEVRIFPNPASSILTIDLSELSSEHVDIYMYNAAGVPVLKKETYREKTLKIDVSEYTSGMYIIQLYDGLRVIRKKVMVKK